MLSGIIVSRSCFSQSFSEVSHSELAGHSPKDHSPTLTQSRRASSGSGKIRASFSRHTRTLLNRVSPSVCMNVLICTRKPTGFSRLPQQMAFLRHTHTHRSQIAAFTQTLLPDRLCNASVQRWRRKEIQARCGTRSQQLAS